jgi:DNA-binding MarR family transcriptional regulator
LPSYRSGSTLSRHVDLGDDIVKTTQTPYAPGRYRPLDPKYWNLLSQGKGSQHYSYNSRSEAVFAVALHAVNRGWDWSEFWFYVSQPDKYLLADAYHHRGGKRAHQSVTDPWRTAKRDWERAERYARRNPAVHRKDEAREVLEQIRIHSLHSKLNATDRCVLAYLHAEAQRRGRIVLSLAVRDVHLGAGVPLGTTHRSLQRLQKAGWISKADSRHNVRHAQVYRLHSPGAGQCSTCPLSAETGPVSDWNTAPPPKGAAGPTAREASVPLCDETPETATTTAVRLKEITSDAMLKLGRYRGLVYGALAQGPLRALDVAKAAGVSKATAHRHLRYLEQGGMAVSEEGVWSRTDRTLEELAADLGVKGLGEERHRMVQQQRKAWDRKADCVQFTLDERLFGKVEAVRRACERREGQQVLREAEKVVLEAQETVWEEIPAGVDPVTGEILEGFLEVDEGWDDSGRPLTFEEIEDYFEHQEWLASRIRRKPGDASRGRCLTA